MDLVLQATCRLCGEKLILPRMASIPTLQAHCCCKYCHGGPLCDEHLVDHESRCIGEGGIVVEEGGGMVILPHKKNL